MILRSKAYKYFRIIIGAAALIYGLLAHDSLMQFMGGWILFMSIFSPCCGINSSCASGSCEIDKNKKNEIEIQ